MRYIARQLGTLVVAPALGAAPVSGAIWIVEGQVVGVLDGDTITVLDNSKTQHKIRFTGIDAPQKGQPFGEQSKQSLSGLVFEKRVEAHCYKKDRYGREVCAVYVSLHDVGLEPLRRGMAWHYREYSARAGHMGSAAVAG